MGPPSKTPIKLSIDDIYGGFLKVPQFRPQSSKTSSTLVVCLGQRGAPIIFQQLQQHNNMLLLTRDGSFWKSGSFLVLICPAFSDKLSTSLKLQILFQNSSDFFWQIPNFGKDTNFIPKFFKAHRLLNISVKVRQEDLTFWPWIEPK